MGGTALGHGRGRWTPRDRERNNPNRSHVRPGNVRRPLNEASDGVNVNAQHHLTVRQNLFQATSEGPGTQPNLNIQQNPLMASEGQADISTLERLMINMLEDGCRREKTFMQHVENLFLNTPQDPAPTHHVQYYQVPSYHIISDLSKSMGKFDGKLGTSRARECIKSLNSMKKLQLRSRNGQDESYRRSARLAYLM